jgi:polyisoprenyl-phosphate glycosyltransferase
MLDKMLSVVVVVHNDSERVGAVILNLTSLLATLVTNYEVVVVDNNSSEDTVAMLRELTKTHPNIQVYSLAAGVDPHVACFAGMEQSIGDFVLLYDYRSDDLTVIPRMLAGLAEGHDIVLARKLRPAQRGRFMYDLLSSAFLVLFRWICNVDLRREAPRFRIISRRVVNYILQHDSSFLAYQFIALLAGFPSLIITYALSAGQPVDGPPSIFRGIRDGLSMLLSSSTAPMRMVTGVCLTAAFLNLGYSVYVVAVFLFYKKVAPGWTTLSLQISGMFFLLAAALAILSEYVIRIASVGRVPRYCIVAEFRSSSFTREQRVNVRESGGKLAAV